MCIPVLCSDNKAVTWPYKTWTRLWTQGGAGWVVAAVDQAIVSLMDFTGQQFGNVLERGKKGKDGAKVLLDSVRSHGLGCSVPSVLVTGG